MVGQRFWTWSTCIHRGYVKLRQGGLKLLFVPIGVGCVKSSSETKRYVVRKQFRNDIVDETSNVVWGGVPSIPQITRVKLNCNNESRCAAWMAYNTNIFRFRYTVILFWTSTGLIITKLFFFNYVSRLTIGASILKNVAFKSPILDPPRANFFFGF